MRGATANDVVISVTDLGKGIPPGRSGAASSKNSSGAAKPDGRTPGTGLGLAIARGFVEAMGGTIKAESPAVQATRHAHHPAVSGRIGDDTPPEDA